MAHSHRSNGILDVDIHRHAEAHIAEHSTGIYKVKHNFAIPFAHILGMEITVVARIIIGGYSFAGARLEFEPGVADKASTLLDKRGEMGETLEISLLGAIHIEMVGVGCRYHGNIWREMVE